MTREGPLGRVSEGDLLWEPSPEYVGRANVTRFMRWLQDTRGLSFTGYHDLWRWSVDDLEGFWGAIWDFFGIKAHRPYEKVLTDNRMPGAKWFPGARLNYAERCLSRNDDHVAVVYQSELRPLSTITYKELRDQVSSVAAGLRSLGVVKGDRVAAYMPNIPETLVTFLAAASIGAIWSSCSPEFGSRSAIDRFRQIRPKLLVAVDGYRYGGRDFDRMDAVAEIRSELPTLEHTILVPYLGRGGSPSRLEAAIEWKSVARHDADISFEPVDFDHPLWVLYSSGTTGLPKPIVHGHGGIMLEHLKSLAFHVDLSPEDRFFWFTTTGWMMWNLLIGGLLRGATVCLYDGDPGYPDLRALWRFAQDAGTTYFGASAPFIHACMKEDLQPGKEFDLVRLKGLGSTGAPLSPEGFRWVYDSVKGDVHLGSYSGGTDMCTGFVGPIPLLPVYAGEIQCRTLGARVESYDPEGRSLVDEVGELAITGPMPSMPLYFWNDPDGARYRESYFDTFPGVWRHGDWIKITKRHSCVIYGRSDSTLNRGGVRMGTSEFYSVVEELVEVSDSLVVDTGDIDTEGRLLLFVQMQEGFFIDDNLRRAIAIRLRTELSPRHVPDEIFAIPEIPKTLNGKKMEVPAKKLLAGATPDEAVSIDSMANPASLDFFLELGSLRE